MGICNKYIPPKCSRVELYCNRRCKYLKNVLSKCTMLHSKFVSLKSLVHKLLISLHFITKLYYNKMMTKSFWSLERTYHLISLDFKRYSNKVIFIMILWLFFWKKKSDSRWVFWLHFPLSKCIQHDHSFAENTAEEGQEDRALWMDRCSEFSNVVCATIWKIQTVRASVPFTSSAAS